jgi:hypothetical protein
VTTSAGPPFGGRSAPASRPRSNHVQYTAATTRRRFQIGDRGSNSPAGRSQRAEALGSSGPGSDHVGIRIRIAITITTTITKRFPNTKRNRPRLQLAGVAQSTNRCAWPSGPNRNRIRNRTFTHNHFLVPPLGRSPDPARQRSRQAAHPADRLLSGGSYPPKVDSPSSWCAPGSFGQELRRSQRTAAAGDMHRITTSLFVLGAHLGARTERSTQRATLRGTDKNRAIASPRRRIRTYACRYGLSANSK